MAQQKARLMLIKKVIGGTPVTICGGQTTELTIDNEMVDVTVPTCEDPGGPLVSAFAYGAQTITFNIDGMADNDAAGKNIVQSALAQTIDTYQIIIPGFGMLQGEALISNHKNSAGMKGNMGFSATFQVSGLVPGSGYTPE